MMHTIPFYAIFGSLILDLKAGDANTVFQCLMKVLNDFDVPIDRIIGILITLAGTAQYQWVLRQSRYCGYCG